MNFSREQTNIAKGVAICLMFVHHLYGFNDRLLNGNYYIPTIPSLNLDWQLARVGNICVSIFLFLSGYGLFLGLTRAQQSPLRYSFAKLKDFYLTYWLYFVFFVPIGFLFFKNRTFWDSAELRYSGDIPTFLANFFGWSATYNQEWWFVRVFLITLLLFPLYFKISEKKVFWMVLFSLFLLFLGFTLKVDLWGTFGFLIWQASFVLGIVCAKLKFFSSPLVQHFDNLSWGWILLGFGLFLMSCLLLRWFFGANGMKLDFLIVPFFVYFSVQAIEVIRSSHLFAYLGKYSFQLWLVHSFFCYYYLQDLIYFPKWSPLIFLLLTALSLLSVLGVEYLRHQLFQARLKAS